MTFRSYLEDEEDKPYFHLRTLAYYYEDMERKERFIKEMAAKIVGYDEKLTGNLSDVEKEVAAKLAEFDDKIETLPASVNELLDSWVADGSIKTIIDTTIVDEKIAPLTAQLAEKASKEDVANISSGTPLFANTIGEMTDTTRAYVLLSDGLIYLYNSGSSSFQSTNKQYQAVGIGEKTVTPKETSFLEYTGEQVNLFDKSKVTPGGYYSHTSLAWVVSSSFSQGEFIPAEAGDIIRIPSTESYGNLAVFKNAAGVIFAGANVPADSVLRNFTIPANAVSFSVSMRNQFLDTFMIVKNSPFPTSYVPFQELGVRISDERLIKSIFDYVEANLVIDGVDNKRYEIGNFLGDSITWGFSPYDNSQQTVNYVNEVRDSLNLSQVRNYGYNGSTLGALPGGVRNPMVERYLTMNNNADLVCVFGGTNDWAYGVPLGTVNDTDKTTFYGALKIMMNGLYEKYPKATIVFFTPIHRKGDTANEQGISLKSFRDAVIEVGAIYGVPVLDLFSTSGIFPDNPTNYTTYIPDGVHLNESGNVKLAKRITGFLRTL